MIIYLIRKKCNRFGLLQRAIPDFRKQMLTRQLRKLEEDGLLERKIFAEIPPRVEYYITDYGTTLLPIINAMSEWGLMDMNILQS